MKTIEKILGLFLLLLMMACGKEGPMGPQGPSGNDGYVNVKTARVTVYSNQWTWDQNSANWYVTIDSDAITDDVFNNGATFIYMNVNGSWSQLPLTYYYQFLNEETNEWINCEATIEVLTSSDHSMTLRWTESDFYDGMRPETHEYKIVAIEPSFAALHPDVNYADYEEVKAEFQLAD